MDILFWSGGKDAYLALKIYQENYPDRPVTLLTTFAEHTGVIPHQNIPIENAKSQAKTLGLNLIPVPLPEGCPNEVYLKKVDQAIKKQDEPTDYLLFGDWYLQDIREWREEQFKTLGYSCRFPIWRKKLDELLPLLLLQPVEIRISAVMEEYQKLIKVGEQYNQHFVRQLPTNIDPMGENGEFHTEVHFQSWEDQKPNKQSLF